MKINTKKSLSILFLIIIMILLFRSINIEKYINFQTLKENREYLLGLVKSHSWLSVFVYIFIYIIAAALSLPIAVPLTLIGGFLFGVMPAVIYTNIGATVGAVIAFLIVRYLLGESIQKIYDKELFKFNKNIELYGVNYLLIARFIILIPFFLVNIFASLSKIPLKTFIWTTSIGIIPGSLVYAYAGKNIISINSVKEVFSPKIILAFVVLILFGFASIFIKRLLIRNYE